MRKRIFPVLILMPILVVTGTGCIPNPNLEFLKNDELIVRYPSDFQSVDFRQTQTLGSSETWCVVLGDINGDDNLDLVVGNHGANKVYMNNGSGIFIDSGQVIRSRYRSSYTSSMALADVDNDGDLDLIDGAYRGMLEIYPNDGDGIFIDFGNILPSRSTSLALGDIDNDGHLDIVTNYVRVDKSHLTIYSNDGSGIFANSGPPIMLDTFVGGITLGDIDNDGDLDIAVGNYSDLHGKYKDPGPADKIYLNNGLGRFRDSRQCLGSFHTHCLALGDLDMDGDLDIVAGTEEGLKFYINDELYGHLGIFSESNRPLPRRYGRYARILLRDIDNDQHLDVIAAENSYGKDAIFLNDGRGRFPMNPSIFIDQERKPDRSLSIDIGDIDNDGDLDLVVGKGDPNALGREETAPNRVYFNTLIETSSKPYITMQRRFRK